MKNKTTFKRFPLACIDEGKIIAPDKNDTLCVEMFHSVLVLKMFRTTFRHKLRCSIMKLNVNIQRPR